MGALGVFGLTIPEEYGGAGLSKTAMCVVSEELSRGYIGVGSLGTRSEIAAELILGGGTEAQKARLAAEDRLGRGAADRGLHRARTPAPTSARLRTRAVRDGDAYVVTGNKTWITHAARADLMTMLVRTDPATTDHTGLSMLLAAEAARHRRRPVPRRGHDRRRDRGARLPRHEGIRARLRRLPRAGRATCSAASRARASSS